MRIGIVIDSIFKQIGQRKALDHMLETLHVMDTFEYEIGPYIYLENEYDMDE